jgi:hypothetical protein
MQEEYNQEDFIAEAELELAMSKLGLTSKKNPQKLIKEIALCKIKYGIPVSDSKKMAQLIDSDHCETNVQEGQRSHMHIKPHC